MDALANQRLCPTAHILIQANLLDSEKAVYYQDIASASHRSLLRYLAENQLVSAKSMAMAIAQSFRLPLVDLTSIERESIPTPFINEEWMLNHPFIPLFKRGTRLYLATDDPNQEAALKDIQFHTGWSTHLMVVETDKLHDQLAALLHQKEDQGFADFLEMEEQNNGSPIDTPIVALVNKILTTAIRRDVSDIHFEPYEMEYRIRYRQDGLLNQVASLPIHLSSKIAARLKIMSNLDISEKRIPQDGRFKMSLFNTKSIDFRVSSCPTLAGEKIVVRLLNQEATKLDVDALGFNPTQKNLFLQAIHHPQGMILVTGPTGSGKTLTLYSALAMLNTIEKNIVTVEDPVEIKVPGINQVNIQPKTGLTFSNVLRSILRQDPDIIMIGEIRDLETAEIAIKSAQTGHLVLSTLHTNNAAETLTRLLNMGISSAHIASAVRLIIAQRLVRRLCDHCKVCRHDLSSQELISMGFSAEEAAAKTIYKARGCSHCVHGYKGRIGLFEIIPMSKEISRILWSSGTSIDVLLQAEKEGMQSLYQSGLEKIKAGFTSIEEVRRVIHE